MPEPLLVWLGVGCYGASAAAAWATSGRGRHGAVISLTPLGLGVVALAAAIAVRWAAIGQGPFLTLYEVLLSNLFSLGLIYALASWWLPPVRASAVIVLPLLAGLGAWMLSVPRDAVPLPPTFDNPWLWLHVSAGKVFLGSTLVGVGLSVLLIVQSLGWGRRWSAPGVSADLLDALVWRFMAVAFVFQSAMLVAGAVWARDAWGRHWAWDPLETWAFATWLALAVVLHLRVTLRVPAWGGWVMVIGVFTLAFLTFFGVPFLSLAPHKGIL